MDRERLAALLDAEAKVWAAKPYRQLIAELDDVAAYERASGADFHQFEVLLLERTPDYVHVGISIDDGSLWRSFSPLSHSFLVYRDGRVEC